MKKAAKITGWVLLALICLTPVVCWIFKINVTALSIKSKGADRVERIDGYYVAVYEQTVCGYIKDGRPVVSMGNCSDVTDYEWKHEELFGCVPYKRFLCFSKEAKAERYHLFNEDKTLVYGAMFVVRTPKGTVHYYYTRTPLIIGVNCSTYLTTAENITFNCDGNEIALDNYCSFTSDIDFTTGEHPLYINGERCVFAPSGSR